MGTRVSEMNQSMMSSLCLGKGNLCDSAETPHGDLLDCRKNPCR